MRRYSFPIFMALLAAFLAVWGWKFYAPDELSLWNGVVRVAHAPSAIDLTLTIRYPKPPIYEERYHITDYNGVSKYRYEVRSYRGLLVKVTQPPHATYDVAFFFEALETKGLWKLTDTKPRSKNDPVYTLVVKQSLGGQSGSRTVVFSNPHFWATTAARYHNIHIDAARSKNGILEVQSTSLLDPRYEEILHAFTTFGPDEFRRDVAAARERARHA